MKTMGRDVIKFHYKEELSLEIEYCHNSSQIIAENVKPLIEDSLFLQWPLNANVYFFFLND